LSEAELLAILLRTGTRKHGVLSFSKKILNSFKECPICDADVKALQTIEGLGVAKACEIVACF
jgi:DNA repair protein RadC